MLYIFDHIKEPYRRQIIILRILSSFFFFLTDNLDSEYKVHPSISFQFYFWPKDFKIWQPME